MHLLLRNVPYMELHAFSKCEYATLRQVSILITLHTVPKCTTLEIILGHEKANVRGECYKNKFIFTRQVTNKSYLLIVYIYIYISSK